MSNIFYLNDSLSKSDHRVKNICEPIVASNSLNNKEWANSLIKPFI